MESLGPWCHFFLPYLSVCCKVPAIAKNGLGVIFFLNCGPIWNLISCCALSFMGKSEAESFRRAMFSLFLCLVYPPKE